MTIFEYFEASGHAFWVDEKREGVWFDKEGGALFIPYSGGWHRWISKDWYK